LIALRVATLTVVCPLTVEEIVDVAAAVDEDEDEDEDVDVPLVVVEIENTIPPEPSSELVQTPL
jgi:hypothetical protein